MGAPLLGRETEIRRLRRVIAPEGPRAAVVAGPPGVGKTRLIEELAASAEARGWTVRGVRGSRSAQAIPLGAFASLLPQESSPEQAALPAMQAALAQLSGLAAQGSLLVVIDDAHDLDDASAMLAHTLAATTSASMVLTVRSAAPLPELIQALWLEERADRFELAPLRREDCDELAAALLGAAVHRSTLSQLWRLTGGNALLTVETLRAGRETGALRERSGMWHHAQPLGGGRRVAAVVESRLARLDADERAALELVAVGQPVPLAVLERITGAAPLEQLERRELIELRSEPGRVDVRTRHPLYAEALIDTLPRMRRRSASRQLAAALGEVGADHDDDLLRLALWQLEADMAGDADALTTAARRAVDLFDHALGERLARAATETGGDVRARLALADALAGQGRGEEAGQELDALAWLAHDDADHARIAIARAWNLATRLADGAGAVGVLADATEKIHDPDWTDELTAVEVTLRSFLGDLAGAAEASARILQRPDATDRSVLQALTISTAVAVLTGHPVTARTDLDRGLRLAQDLGEAVPLAGLKLEANRLLGAEFAGDLFEAEQLAHDAYRSASEQGQDHRVGVCGTLLASTLAARGRITAANRVLAEASIALERTDPLDIGGACAALQALSFALTGDAATAQAALDEHDAGYPAGHRFAALTARARAWTCAQAGLISEATDIARQAAVQTRAAGQPVWAAVLLHDIVRFDRAHADVVEELASIAGQVEGRLVPALAAHAAAAAAGSAERLEHAAEDLEDIGADLAAAEALVQAAAAHRRAGREPAARSTARDSQRIARACAGARTPLLTEPPADLTPRQAAVARLAAERLTSREIAERLHLSVRTVDNHLAQAYAKLGISSRDELPPALAAHHRP